MFGDLVASARVAFVCSRCSDVSFSLKSAVGSIALNVVRWKVFDIKLYL